jgi:hypothetical protein
MISKKDVNTAVYVRSNVRLMITWAPKVRTTSRAMRTTTTMNTTLFFAVAIFKAKSAVRQICAMYRPTTNVGVC